VGSGLVASIARPGGNVTGLSALTTELYAKRVELLKELMPNLVRLAGLFNLLGQIPRSLLRLLQWCYGRWHERLST
jgi:putative ABC transport system substrate-binding protein